MLMALTDGGISESICSEDGQNDEILALWVDGP